MRRNKLTLDKSINPYRDDIAAIKLKGQIEAPKYVQPSVFQICVPSVFIKSQPDKESPSLNEALLGELFEVYEIKDGFAWGQLVRDNYVGYISTSALDDDIIIPTHKINNLRTYGFKDASLKSYIVSSLSFGALIAPKGEVQNNYVDCGKLGFVHEKHICKIEEFAKDPADIAMQYLNAPYTWGGNGANGVDCSGLAQNAYRACGINLPRDARLQEHIGQNIEINQDLSGLQRNDLIFWQGHVALMLDRENMIHANAYHMKTAIEPLKSANERYLAQNLPIRTIRRYL
jgi:NlpC/P60 family/Bacterial dipeptidyl-peptidase Sh3 domain